jgi:hypothetical protein
VCACVALQNNENCRKRPELIKKLQKDMRLMYPGAMHKTARLPELQSGYEDCSGYHAIRLSGYKDCLCSLSAAAAHSQQLC